jgi:hypothetical protein
MECMENPLENSGYEASVMDPNNTMDNRRELDVW